MKFNKFVGLFGLASLLGCSKLFTQEMKNEYNLSSSLENFHYGLKDEGYVVDGSFIVRNNGNKSLSGATYIYNICVATMEKPNEPYSCIGKPKSGLVDKLRPNQEFTKPVNLILDDLNGGAVAHFSLSVFVHSEGEVVYLGHKLGEISQYK